jgi:cytochrome c-type biogenesis protein CcmF
VGQVLEVGGYQAKLVSLSTRPGPNYTAQVATLEVSRAGTGLGTVDAEKRTYPAREMTTTEAGLLTVGASQFYASLGEVSSDGAVGLRLYAKPLILLIWLGALVMAAGGALSLSDRTLRLGAPSRVGTGRLAAAE